MEIGDRAEQFGNLRDLPRCLYCMAVSQLDPSPALVVLFSVVPEGVELRNRHVIESVVKGDKIGHTPILQCIPAYL